ncbi:hypothetical protein Tco_0966895 [Tanacetum coccineum]
MGNTKVLSDIEDSHGPMKMEILLESTSNKLMVDSILQAGNPVKEILLKLNLPNHMSILTDLKVSPTKHGRMTKLYSSLLFIANCFNAGYLKMEVKLKNFKKDATLKLFKSTNQERCSRSHSRQAKEQAQDLKSMNTTTIHKLMIKVKDYELKTKAEA